MTPPPPSLGIRRTAVWDGYCPASVRHHPQSATSSA